MTLQLDDLKPNKGSRRRKLRKGRGIAAGGEGFNANIEFVNIQSKGNATAESGGERPHQPYLLSMCPHP